VTAAGDHVDVDASATRVSIALPPNASAVQLFRLTRDGDPHWLPAAFAPSGLSLTPKAAVQVWLGSGGYELGDPLQPERTQRFEVPRDGEVVVSASLTRARADRP
jgi:hypothetical protein